MEREKLSKMPTRFVLSDLFNDGAALCCPCCGCEQVHAREVFVEQGYTATRVGGDGTGVVWSDRHKTKRGSAIGLAFYCEWGCTFDYVFEFHKGTMSVSLLAGSHTDDLGELWRD